MRRRLTSAESVALLSMGLYLASCLAATFIAKGAYGLWFDFVGFTNLAKTLLALALLLVAYVYLRDSERLYRALVWALIIPPIIPVALALLVLVMQSAHHFELDRLFNVTLGNGCEELGDAACNGRVPLVTYGGRLLGLTANPFQACFGIITALSFLWPMALLAAHRERWIYALAILALTELLIVGLLWTQVRSAAVALLFVMVFGAATMLRYVKAVPRLYAGVATAAVLLIAGAWGMLPVDASSSLIARFEPTQAPPLAPSKPAVTATGGAPASPAATPAAPTLSTQQPSQSAAVPPTVPDPSENSVSSNYGRLTVWKYYAKVAAHNLLGVGFNYEQRFFVFNAHNERVTTHNNILMTWMLGGVLATAGLVMLWLQLFRSIVTGLRSDAGVDAFIVYVGVAGAFVSMWLLSITAGNLIGEFEYSILIAMVLAGPPRLRKCPAGPCGAIKFL